MDKTRHRCGTVAGASIALLASGAAGDFTGVVAELDEYGLDGVTPLTEIPGYAGEVVYNIYATFSDPDDQCVGVVGSPDNPFQVGTVGGVGFVNSLISDFKPPLPAEAALPLKVQTVTVGALVPSLYIPPPSCASLPMKEHVLTLR